VAMQMGPEAVLRIDELWNSSMNPYDISWSRLVSVHS